MPSVDFLQPRLCGPRFKEGEIPLDVLNELITLNKAVTEVAHWQYSQSNPSRRRTAPEFKQAILKLDRLETGSAIPVIKLVTPESAVPGIPLFQTAFEEAHKKIIDVLTSVEIHDKLPSDSQPPLEILERLKNIGQSLHDGESLVLYDSNHKKSIKIDNRTHDKLSRLILEARHTREVVLRGVVHKIDQRAKTFGLKPISGSIVTGNIPDSFSDTMMKAFIEYKNNVKVLIRGVAQCKSNDSISHIEPVTKVDILDKLDVPAQLDRLRGMKKGWLDGEEGEVPSPSDLDWLSDIFERHYPHDATRPSTVPTPDGGVDMEWSIGQRKISLEIDLINHIGEWLDYHINTKSHTEKKLTLDDPNEWKWIGDQIILANKM